MKPNAKPVFIKSLLRIHWGYIVRQPGASAAQLSYLIPPPSTIVGAFANPLARLLDLNDGGLPYTTYSARKKRLGLPMGSYMAKCATDSTLAASAYLSSETVGAAYYGESSRIIGAGYKGGGSYQEAVKKPIYESVSELMPVQAVGASVAPNATMTIAWVLDINRLGKCLNKTITQEQLRHAAWQTYRIGSREGLANVEFAETGVPEILSSGAEYETLFYQPSRCTKPLKQVTIINLLQPWGTEETFYTPSGQGSGSAFIYSPLRPVPFALREGCQAYKIGENEVLASLIKRW